MQINYEYTASSRAYVNAFITALVRFFIASVFGFGLMLLDAKTGGVFRTSSPYRALFLVYVIYIAILIAMFVTIKAKRLILNDDGVFIKQGGLPWNNQIRGVKWENIASVSVGSKKTNQGIEIQQKDGMPLWIDNIKNVEDAVSKISAKLQ